MPLSKIGFYYSRIRAPLFFLTLSAVAGWRHPILFKEVRYDSKAKSTLKGFEICSRVCWHLQGEDVAEVIV